MVQTDTLLIFTSLAGLVSTVYLCPVPSFELFYFMDQLIASYLYQTKSCPLTGLGGLFIKSTASIPDFSNKLIHPPIPEIQFVSTEYDPADLISYIIAATGADESEVTVALDHYSDQLKNKLSNNGTAYLEGIGHLYINSSGVITFKSKKIPDQFLPAVTAKRVIHPNAEHNLLVGDKETTNTEMSEFLNVVPVMKDRWWIWAIVIAAVAGAAILIYGNDKGSSSFFGNAIGF